MKTPPEMPETPPEGTQALCSFCHEIVMLVPVSTQRWHWLYEGDPIDGRRHCLGGVHYGPGLRTLHKPWSLAWMYDADGRPLSATGLPMPDKH